MKNDELTVETGKHKKLIKEQTDEIKVLKNLVDAHTKGFMSFGNKHQKLVEEIEILKRITKHLIPEVKFIPKKKVKNERKK